MASLANSRFNGILISMLKHIVFILVTSWGMLNPALGQTELIVNGGFESSTASIAPWQILAAPNAALSVLSPGGAYGGSSESLLLGGGNNYSQDVYQTIAFPSNLINATLTFYYNVVTTDSNPSQDATLYLKFTDANQNMLDSAGPVSNLTPTAGYQQYSATFVHAAGSVYAGKTVTFHFVAATANVFAAYTQFYLDNVSLQIATTADIPANDNFTNRFVIAGSAASLLADNTYASKETGETNHAANVGGHSIWWSWIAPSNGIVAVKAIGSAFQPLLAAYTGSAVNQLALIAANNGSPAQISFKAVAGTQYAIAVDGNNGATGSVRLTLGFASDVTPPSVTITAPSIGANLTNPFVQVKGVASDNLSVYQVQYRLENPAVTNDYQPAIGTNNWSAMVTDLIPGYNLVRVRALDSSSNFSVGVTRTFDYLVGSPITLSISGRGSVTGATNGQSLNLGNLYSLTAVPASGFGFSAWTGNYFSRSPSLAFMMRSNLTLQANFVDVARPTLAITNLPLAGNISNELFVIKGKAGDNLEVTNVYYNFNHTSWIMADTTNSWTNWSASLNLAPGTNFFSAYATDSTGNVSLTNTVKFVYVLSAQLTVSTNGKGSISPALNGALLQIGKNYALGATPAVGFRFTNWTDGTGAIVTNKPVVTFQMVSNLSLTANFVDFTRPTLAITNIPLNGRVSNQLFTVRGKAGDNLAVTNVFYSLNHATWDVATTTNNWNTWWIDLGLTPGTNVISAYAVDSTGNYSLTNTVKVVYILSATLTVSTNGRGAISPAVNGALLQIGRNFTLTATPGLGFAFTNWTDGSSAIVTNKPALTFPMASNLAFTANFVDVMKPTLLITNVAAGQRWSNNLFTVKGRVTDNLAVTNVSYNLNGLGWTPANFESGGTNWSAPLVLTPGTNAISAYATDGAGNVSATNTVKIFYVVSAVVTVQIVGGGILTPNYNGQSLAIGNNYSMKAAATNGFVFNYWSGDVPMTTNATLNFFVASNKTVVAHFLDVLKPVVTITLPFADQKWSNQIINVAGTASDNLGVADVWVQFNKGGWTEAVTDNGFANWSSTNFTVYAETNLVEAYAVDAAGHVPLLKAFFSGGIFPIQVWHSFRAGRSRWAIRWGIMIRRT